MLAFVLLVSFLLTAFRLIAWVQFESLRIRDRKTSCKLIALKKLGVRSVDIYISHAYSGSPFTGGLFNPYICFPQVSYSLLSPNERDAVIAHEIGHIRHFDLFQSMIVSLMGDLLWFVPFYRMTARKIDIHREILADHYATSTNVSHGALAQALVKLKEISLSPPKPALYSAFAKSKSTLEQRVNLILNRKSKPRFNIWRSIYFYSCGLVITGTVLSATFGGNYEIEKSQSMQQQVEGRIKRRLGIE
jgi:beta-lactamase regulating signal transducer with metallopeptidase domain